MTETTTPRRHDATRQGLDRRAFVKLAVAGGGASLAAACGWDGGNAIRPERSAMLPSYFISAMMPMLVNPSAWRLRVDGLVRQPLELSVDDLMRMPPVSYTVKHTCVEGWSAIATWHGVPVSAIVEYCRPLPTARYINFVSFDSGYSNGWDLASALHPQTILAYGMNDQPLTPAHGAPLRLYSPTKLGYKLTKYLVSMTFTERRPGGYWEDQGYPWFGGI